MVSCSLESGTSSQHPTFQQFPTSAITSFTFSTVRVGSEGETQAEGEDNKQHCVHSSPSVTPLHANSAGIHCVLNAFKRCTDDIIDKHALSHSGTAISFWRVHDAQPIKSHHVTVYETHSSTSVATVESTVYKSNTDTA